MRSQIINSFAERVGTQAVHRSWRDNKLRQGRDVPEIQMHWDTLPLQDKDLDCEIAKDVARCFLDWIDEEKERMTAIAEGARAGIEKAAL